MFLKDEEIDLVSESGLSIPDQLEWSHRMESLLKSEDSVPSASENVSKPADDLIKTFTGQQYED